MRFTNRMTGAAGVALLAAQSTNAAVTLDITSTSSIKNAASTIAYNMMTYYTGNQTGSDELGTLNPGLYYWWEAGGMWGNMVDYWYYTGDTSYNDVVSAGLLSQTGPDDNYMPAAQQKDEGNDDQGFWGMAVMSAAEAKFPNPPSSDPQWLALAQGVFNSQALRWDNTTCGGGLRWQIFTFNNGYNYKNSISNGCFFNIAARLYRYTSNETYLDWAEKTWEWMEGVGLMSSEYQFYDGSNDLLNCSEFDHIQWTYNAGVFLYGSAILWNKTQSTDWYTRTQGIWKASSIFFTGTNGQVMYEVACEPGGTCDTDQLSFKAYLARWMAATIKVFPDLADTIMPYLQTSAEAAVATCTGTTEDGLTTSCGTKWTTAAFDKAGVGQQMSALSVVQSLLIDQVAGPVSNTTGGTSTGNPNAGTSGDSVTGENTSKIKTSDRAGAGIITAIILIGLLGGAWWMIA